MFTRPCEQAQSPWQGPGLGSTSLPAYCLFLRVLFPPHLPLGLGDQVGSCPVLPHHAISGLGHSSLQGWALEAPGQRVPLPSAVYTRFRWGGPQSHSGKGFIGRSSLGPRKAGSPPSLPPDHLQKHSLTHCRLLSLSACFPNPDPLSLAQPMLLWPSVFFPGWRFPRDL